MIFRRVDIRQLSTTILITLVIYVHQLAMVMIYLVGCEIRLDFMSECPVCNNNMGISRHGPLTRYVKFRVAHAPGCRERFPRHRVQRKPLVSDHDMHHDTCVTHVPWCMPGSPTRVGGENVPGILRIWQEAHGNCRRYLVRHDGDMTWIHFPHY